jgi:hypothetical protein
VAISAIEAFVVKFLWSAVAAAVSPTSPFDEPLFLHSHQGIFMVDLLDNFLNPLKLSGLWWVISRNHYDREWRGSGEKDKWQAGYGESGERWVERAEV